VHLAVADPGRRLRFRLDPSEGALPERCAGERKGEIASQEAAKLLALPIPLPYAELTILEECLEVAVALAVERADPAVRRGASSDMTSPTAAEAARSSASIAARASRPA
jgi:hypothetical protein